MKILGRLALAVVATILSITQSYGQQLNPSTGLVEAGDWQLVYASCIVCHSLTVVTAQRGDAERWRNIVHEMQSSRNMWALASETEEKIVAYLAEYFPPDRVFSRRPPLPPELLPERSF